MIETPEEVLDEPVSFRVLLRVDGKRGMNVENDEGVTRSWRAFYTRYAHNTNLNLS